MNRASCLILCGALCTMGACAGDRAAPAPEPALAVVSSGSLRDAALGVTGFAWAPDATIVLPDERYDGARADAIIRSEIRAVLTERGYELPGEGDPERLIAFALGLEDRLPDATLAGVFGLNPGLQTGAGTTKGTLVIAITGPGRSPVYWRGAVPAVAALDESRAQREDRLRGAVRRLLNAMPRR